MSLQKGLVLHQKLDKESYNLTTKRFSDKTPYSNHGTSANAGVFDTDRMGHDNEVTVFNGTSDYIDCGNDDSINFLGDKTISCWMKKPSGAWCTMVGTREGKTDYTSPFNLSIVGLVPRFTMGCGSGWFNTISSESVDEGWHFIVGRISGNSMKIFVDGVEKGSETFTGSQQYFNKLTVGCAATTGAPRWFEGSIDDVRVYNRALSEDEITLLYESYKPKLAIGSRQKGLVLDMPLRNPYTKGGAAGSEILTDRTPWSNDGTNHGATISSDPAVFNGTSDYIDCGNDSSLDFTDEMTVSFWMYPTDITPLQRILNKYLSPDRTYSFKIHNGILTPEYWNSAGTIITPNATYTIPLINNWYHVITVFDGTHSKIYVNGILEDDQSFSSQTLKIITCNLDIGRYSGNIQYYRGSIDDVRVYSRALSELEIVDHYNETKGKY